MILQDVSERTTMRTRGDLGFRKVRQPAHTGAYDFQLAMGVDQLEIVGSGVRRLANLAI